MAEVELRMDRKAQKRQIEFKKVILVYALTASRKYKKVHVRWRLCATGLVTEYFETDISTCASNTRLTRMNMMATVEASRYMSFQRSGFGVMSPQHFGGD
jgi:hypothetical protein